MSIKKAVLKYKDEKSDKVYEVEIVYLAWEQYHVNYAYGKTGTKLKQGTKTTNPVSLQEAETIYDNLVKSKKDKGYNLVSYNPRINQEFLWEISLNDRQAMIDHLKQANPENLLEEIKKVGINPLDYLMAIDLSNANLQNADLRYCDLSQTNLFGADLTGAKLQGANIKDIQIDANTKIDHKWKILIELIKFGGNNRDLQGVDLSNLDFDFYDDYDLKINLSGANLEGANLSESDLYNFDFSNANLKNANLHQSRLYYFTGANLEGANLSDTEFGEADFDNAICINTDFSRMSCNDEFFRFENANFTGANFQEAVFNQCLISGANFTNANFTGAIGFERFIAGIEGSEITDEVSFKNANLSQIDISNCNYLIDICGIEFINWQGAKFNKSNLSKTDFSGFILQNVSFQDANLKGANLENCNLEGADFTGANLEDANLKGVDISKVFSFENVKINENTQVDEKWQQWLKEQQQKSENNFVVETIEKPTPTESINLQTITIQTPTVNKKGEIIKTESYEIKYFRETLPNGVELDMISIPEGTFWMGDENESPRHQVTVPSFYMAKYPITQEQWRAIAQLEPINRDLTIQPAHFPGDKRPVENISWRDAVEFCQRLSHLTNKNYQLPSEAQWEYACRAGTTTPFSFGETITRKLANCNSVNIFTEETTAVGRFFPNAFGLYDMHGNVWEWCLDDWRCNYYAGNQVTDGSAFIAPHDFTEQKALRGGCFNLSIGQCTSASRYPEYPVTVRQFYGFRVVCSCL